LRPCMARTRGERTTHGASRVLGGGARSAPISGGVAPAGVRYLPPRESARRFPPRQRRAAGSGDLDQDDEGSGGRWSAGALTPWWPQITLSCTRVPLGGELLLGGGARGGGGESGGV